MLRSIRGRLLVVSLVSLGPIAVAGAFLDRALTSQLEASRAVEVTNAALKLLGTIDGDLSRIQTAIGTYVLFADPGATLTADGAYASAKSELAALRLVQDDPVQARRAQTLERMLDDWQREQGQALGALAQAGQRAAAVQLAGASWLILQALREQHGQAVAAEHAHLGLRMAAYSAAQRHTKLVLLLGGLGAIAVAVAAAGMLGAHITRPLRHLTRSARAVAAGDMTRRVDVTTRDEIGVLATAFNAMMAQVTERQEALERARAEAESHLAIARVVGGADNLQEALRLICRELARLTGADTVAAFVLDPSGVELRPLAGYRVPKAALPTLMGLRLPLAEQGFRDEVVVRGRPAWSDDVGRDPRFAFATFRQFAHQSSLILPLTLEEVGPPGMPAPDPAVRVSGAFYLVWWTGRRRFTEVELATLQTVGQQVGVLLHNARLVEALESRAARLRTLAGLNQLVSSSLDVETVLRGIARAAAELVGAPVASFWLADDARRLLDLRALSDEALGADVSMRTQRYDEGALGWVALHRQPLSVPSVLDHEGFPDQSWWRTHGLSSFLAVPVVLDDALLAVLSLNGTSPFQLGAADWELVEMFVTQAGVAIRNARLYAESALRAKRLEILTRLARVMTSSLDPDAILPVMAEAAVSLFRGAACRVWIAEDERVGLRAEAGVRGTGGGRRLELPLGEGLIGRVCATGIPVLLEDIFLYPDLQNEEWVRAQGFRSIAALPLTVGRSAIGAFVVITRETHRFDDDEVALLHALAEQTAVVLHKARLFRDVQDRQRLTDDLYALALALERSMDLHHRLRAFVARAVTALGFERIAVMLAGSDGKGIEVVASTDTEPGPVRRIPLREVGGGYARVWESGETLVITSDDELAALPPLAPAIREDPVFRARRFVMVPLKFRDRSIGVVSADNEARPRSITPESVVRLELFCQELAQAVNNARLYGETQLREREVTILFEFTRRIAATLDLDEVLDIILECATDTLGCRAAAVYRWDAGAGELVLARSRNIDDPSIRTLRFRAGEGIAGRAFAERRPVWTDDRASDPHLGPGEGTAAIPHASPGDPLAMIGVPIVIRDGVYGVLLAYHLQPHPWTEAEVRLLSRLSTPAAVAIENARLYAETQQNLAGAGLLNEAARTLHRALDVRRRLPSALADLGRIFGAAGVAVTVFDDAGSEPGQTVSWGVAAQAGVGSIAALCRDREDPLLVADLEAVAEAVPEALRSDVRGLAAFPVRGRSRILGVLALLFGTRRELSPVEQRLLAAYADQLAMALDNAALFKETENQKTRLEHIFASTSDGILFLDRSNRIAALNRRGEELLGIPTGHVVGQPLEHLVSALSHRLTWMAREGRSLVDVVADPGEEATGDLEVRDPYPRTLRWHASPALDAQGARMGVTLTLQDVTREREVDRMKTEFVSTVSHELRTPLTSIKGSLHLLLHEESSGLDPARRDLLGICLSNTDRLIRLINDILDVSRIEAGQIQLVLSRRRVDEFVGVAADGIRALAASRGVTVVTALAPDLPEVRVDLDRMVQVMINLLSNAIKFSPVESEVLVRAEARGGWVEIRVIDRGRGVDQVDVPRLFQKFQQLDGRTVREVGGSGLGLAICRGIVNEHGGDIRVESTPGHGATFIVTLAPDISPPAPLLRARALPVDDDPHEKTVR